MVRKKKVVLLQFKQVTAASKANGLMGMCPRNGVVKSVRAGSRVIAAAAETMTIMVTKGGVDVLSGNLVLDDSNTTMVGEAGSLHATPANLQVAVGDWFEANLTYAAGGGPTPMVDTVVTAEIEVD